MNTTPILESWRQFDAVAHDYLRPITSEADHARALELLETLWEEVPDGQTDHPLFALLELLTLRVTAFEEEIYPLPESSPERVLWYLMTEQNLTQVQLAQASGIHQGNLSKILKGERSLTVEQIRTLSRFFKVNPSVFF